MKVRVIDNYIVIKKNGETVNLKHKSGNVVKKHWLKTDVQFEEGTFPIMNEALKKESR